MVLLQEITGFLVRVLIFVIICFVCLSLVLEIVLYLFNGELLLGFISLNQAVQTPPKKSSTLGQYPINC